MINFGKHVSTVLAAAALCGSSALAQVVISDFGVVNPLAISLGDFTWTGDIASSGIAQFVGIATGTALQSGGAAATFTALDITGGGVNDSLSLAAARSGGFSLGTWRVTLQSSPGFTSSYDFSPSSFPDGSFGTVSIALASPSATSGGGAVFTSITAYSIIGDGSASKFVAGFTDLSATAVPEPQVYALVSGVGLAAFALYRRGRKSVA